MMEDLIIGVDAPRTTQQQASALFIHHAKLAVMYFEAGLDEVMKEMATKEVDPIIKFLEELIDYYEKM